MFSISCFSVASRFRWLIRSQNRMDILRFSCSDCPSKKVGPIYFGVVRCESTPVNFFSFCWLPSSYVRTIMADTNSLTLFLHAAAIFENVIRNGVGEWIGWHNAVCRFFFYCYEDQMCSCTLVKVIVDNAFVVSKNATHIGVVQLHSWYHCKSCEHFLVDT